MDIQFTSKPPEFILDGFTTKPLTCTEDDSNWSLQLPAATTEEFSAVEVTLLATEDDGEYFVLTDGILSLTDSARQDFSNGRCPGKESLDLKFKLKSKLVGENE